MVGNPDFVASLGRPFVAHRLRRLSELFVDGYAEWLPGAGVSVPARSLSTMLLLARDGPLGVTELAARLRLSHPLLIRMVEALEALGFVAPAPDPSDARRRPVALTEAGRAEAERIAAASATLDRAFARLFEEIGVDLTAAATRAEQACTRESFVTRLERATQEIEQGKEVECV